jgi:hypothetical protein
MAEAIDAHRYHAARLSRLEGASPIYARRASFPCLSVCEHGQSLCHFIRAAAARAFERRSRCHLLAARAQSADEAREKVLYVMAALIAGQMRLNTQEIAQLVASVARFEIELSGFLRIVDQRWNQDWDEH